jgi:hypothetical protein
MLITKEITATLSCLNFLNKLIRNPMVAFYFNFITFSMLQLVVKGTVQKQLCIAPVRGTVM